MIRVSYNWNQVQVRDLYFWVFFLLEIFLWDKMAQCANKACVVGAGGLSMAQVEVWGSFPGNFCKYKL